MMRSRRLLMCRPTHFTVSYSINPWMDPSRLVDTDRAIRQWSSLRDAYRSLGHTVEEIDPIPGLPDMVFAANGATVIDGTAYGAQFRHSQRAAEAPAYRNWLTKAGYRTHDAKRVNEGEGDLMLAGRYLLAGTGFRTDRAAHAEAQEIFGRPVISLELIDPDYYHLDTAVTVLDAPDGDPDLATIAYLPRAFSESSRRVLTQLFPDAIIAAKADAEVLGLNAVSDGRNVVIAAQATGFAKQLHDRGFRPVPVDLSELMKAGGGAKCCTLNLHAG